MKSSPQTPAKCLPPWARAYFDRWRDRFNEMEMVSIDSGETLAPTHRHNAFYRLFCTDNDGMRRMWRRADEVVVIDMDASSFSANNGYWFLGALIYSTDYAVPDEKKIVWQPLPKPPAQRLNPEQRAARKVAYLLQCLSRATPRDCYASQSGRCHFIGTVEWLVIRYGFDLGPFDYNRFNQVYDLTYTRDSKRGWIQHRRAHDRIRHKVIAAIQRLMAITPDPSHRLIAELRQIVADLATWPDMKIEHGHQIDRLSNKASWADWLRYAYDQWLYALEEYDEARGHLRHCDWATLAATLFPEYFDAGKTPDERLIRAIIADVEASRPERRRIGREKILAEDAAFKAWRAAQD